LYDLSGVDSGNELLCIKRFQKEIGNDDLRLRAGFDRWPKPILAGCRAARRWLRQSLRREDQRRSQQPTGAYQGAKRLDTGDVLIITRLDRLARSTRDLLNILDDIAKRGAGFRSLHDAWADTTSIQPSRRE